MRCFQCQRFGHSKTSCRGSLTCARCSSVGHDTENCTAAALCVNCKGDHPGFSRSCPKWKTEKEVQTTKVNRNISYAEARRLVQSTHLQPNRSYASAVKATRTVATQTLINAQIPPNKTLRHASQKKETPTHVVQKPEIAIQSKSKNEPSKIETKNRSNSNSSFEDMVSESLDSDMCLAVQETNLKPDQPAKLQRFSFVRKDNLAGERACGGVGLLTSLDYPSSFLPLTTSLQVVAIQ
ncbi:uncharacterized protein LOC118196737, partial [Stegodyphus dumicola]|uniref:uncharacterized protein LOC118196737 n=1 Tax=Stegodyphus dumicola TaxID=202533 RepID=UPI0015B2215C